MKVHFIATRDDLVDMWQRVEPFIDRAIGDAGQGEYTTQDVFRMASERRAVLFLAEDEEGDVLGGALEFVEYPQGRALNIMAISGGGLRDLAAEAMDEVCRFAHFTGAKWLQASTSPAMARLLATFGFQTIYHVSRVKI